MVTFKYLPEMYYRRSDETVQTVIVNDCQVVYLHYKDGYYSYIIGLENLMGFLNGDTNCRFFCSNNTTEFESMVRMFEPLFTEDEQ